MSHDDNDEATLAGFGLIFWPETETDGEPILPAKLQVNVIIMPLPHVTTHGDNG